MLLLLRLKKEYSKDSTNKECYCQKVSTLQPINGEFHLDVFGKSLCKNLNFNIYVLVCRPSFTQLTSSIHVNIPPSYESPFPMYSWLCVLHEEVWNVFKHIGYNYLQRMGSWHDSAVNVSVTAPWEIMTSFRKMTMCLTYLYGVLGSFYSKGIKYSTVLPQNSAHWYTMSFHQKWDIVI